MPRMFLTHAVEDVAKWKSFDDERSTNMAAFATDICSYTDPAGGNTAGVAMTVTDQAALQDFMRSDACEAILRRHGVIKPISVYVA